MITKHLAVSRLIPIAFLTVAPNLAIFCELDALLPIAILIGLLLFLIGKPRLQDWIFASVCLRASFIVSNPVYLHTPVFSLQLSDICLLIADCIILARHQSFKKSLFLYLSLFTLLVSIFSALASPYPVAIGQIVRFSSYCFFCIYLVSSDDLASKTEVLKGLLSWPIIWILAALASGTLSQSLLPIFNFKSESIGISLLNARNTVGSLSFLLPLSLTLGWDKRFRNLAFILLAVLISLSNQRSLIISAFICLLIYSVTRIRISSKLRIKSIFIIVAVTILMSASALTVSRLGYFDFSRDGVKVKSSLVYYNKVSSAFSTFTQNPLLGVGFGVAMTADQQLADSLATNGDFYEYSSTVSANAEVTFLQILAETGLAGFIPSSLLLLHAARNTVKSLHQYTILPISLIASICFWFYSIPSLIASNAYLSIFWYASVPLVLCDARVNSSKPCSKDHS